MLIYFFNADCKSDSRESDRHKVADIMHVSVNETSLVMTRTPQSTFVIIFEGESNTTTFTGS